MQSSVPIDDLIEVESSIPFTSSKRGCAAVSGDDVITISLLIKDPIFVLPPFNLMIKITFKQNHGIVRKGEWIKVEKSLEGTKVTHNVAAARNEPRDPATFVMELKYGDFLSQMMTAHDSHILFVKTLVKKHQ